GDKSVTEAVFGDEIAGIARVRLDALTQPAYIYAHIPRIILIIGFRPQFSYYLDGRHGVACIPDQQGQQAKLQRRKLRPLATHVHLHTVHDNRHAGVDVHLPAAVWLVGPPAQQRIDTRPQQVQPYRLRHEIIRTDIQPVNDVVLMPGNSGDHHNGDIGELPDAFADFVAAKLRHEHIQYDEVRVVAIHQRQPVHTVVGRADCEAFGFQIPPQELVRIRLVVDENDVHERDEVRVA